MIIPGKFRFVSVDDDDPFRMEYKVILSNDIMISYYNQKISLGVAKR